MLGLDEINSLTHWVENVFDAARNDQLTFNRSLVHLVFQSIDKLSVMIDCLKDPSLEAVEIDGVVGQIQQVLDSAGASRKQATQADAEGCLVDESPVMELPAAETVEPSLSAQDSAPGEENEPVSEINHFADIQDDPEPSSKYIAIFIDETEMSLDELSDLLLSDSTKKRTESLMVQCHKIKGSAAAIGLNQAAKLPHFMEDLLQNLMGSGEPLTEAMTEAMLQSIDALRAYVEGLKSGHSKTEQFNQVYCRLVACKRWPAVVPMARWMAREPRIGRTESSASESVAGAIVRRPRNGYRQPIIAAEAAARTSITSPPGVGIG